MSGKGKTAEPDGLAVSFRGIQNGLERVNQIHEE